MSTSRTKLIVAISLILIISAASLIFYHNIPTETVDLSRVACVGDSITEITTYVSTLQTLLGSDSVASNFGASGSTVSLGSVEPYLFENISSAAEEFQPTTVIILLGTNDARADAFPYTNTFIHDYKLLISKFQSLESNPQIYLAIPPPVYNNTIKISNSDLTDVIIPLIRQVANETGLPIIDVYTPMLNHPDYFVDGVHPNDDGARVIAETVYQQITRKP